MKSVYRKPKAEMINFNYPEQIVCSGGIKPEYTCPKYREGIGNPNKFKINCNKTVYGMVKDGLVRCNNFCLNLSMF